MFALRSDEEWGLFARVRSGGVSAFGREGICNLDFGRGRNRLDFNALSATCLSFVVRVFCFSIEVRWRCLLQVRLLVGRGGSFVRCWRECFVVGRGEDCRSGFPTRVLLLIFGQD